jgi:hypothetical protein
LQRQWKAIEKDSRSDFLFVKYIKNNYGEIKRLEQSRVVAVGNELEGDCSGSQKRWVGGDRDEE